MKKFITILLIMMILQPSILFAATKLPNGNYEYTPEEVNNIRKTLEIFQNIKKMLLMKAVKVKCSKPSLISDRK